MYQVKEIVVQVSPPSVDVRREQTQGQFHAVSHISCGGIGGSAALEALEMVPKACKVEYGTVGAFLVIERNVLALAVAPVCSGQIKYPKAELKARSDTMFLGRGSTILYSCRALYEPLKP